MDKSQIQKDFCLKILEVDKDIRFAAIVDNLGQIAAAEYREGVLPLLSKQELELSVMQEAMRMATRKGMETDLGELIYTFSLYEKVKRATIPLINLVDHILVVSFDIKADHESIILKKILPHLQKYGLYKKIDESR